MAPAEAGEVIEDGFGQKPAGFVFHYRHRTVALGKLLSVRPVDKRQVRKNRNLGAEGLIQINLTRRVVDVVGTADHVADLHVPVIHHHGKVVGGNAVTHDDEVIEFLVGNRDRAVNGIIPGHVAVIGIAETDHGLDAFGNRAADAVFRTPAAVVAGLKPLGTLLFAHLIELFGGGVALVGAAVGEHLIDDFAVAVQTIHLIDGALVVVEVEPLHRIENDLRCLIGGALLISVFDAQQELAAQVPGHSPAVNGGTGSPQVHHAGGRGSNTGTDFFHHNSLSNPERR